MTMTNTLTRARVSRSQQQLDSLEILNYRAFRSLKIERLGNVNLIVGKNSVGKSALLEALRLYASQGAPEVIGDLLQERDEWSSRNEWSPRTGSAQEIEKAVLPVTNLFYGRPLLDPTLNSIRIGPAGLSAKTLTLEVEWFVRKTDDLGQSTLVRASSPATDVPDWLADEVEPRLVVQYNSDKGQIFRLDRDRDWSRRYSRSVLDRPRQVSEPAFVPVNGLTREEMVRRWEQISLLPEAEFAISAAQIIVPAVQKLDIIGREYSPVVKAKLLDVEQPVPVRSLGEGVIRLFGLALALATAQDTLLLVDEIDSGLHHSVQVEMWRLIFTVAERLNVQVFATTHSWDCVAAFQQVAAEDHQQDGMLIRLQKEGDEIVPVLVDEETLTIVTREQIEIR